MSCRSLNRRTPPAQSVPRTVKADEAKRFEGTRAGETPSLKPLLAEAELEKSA